MAEDSCKLFVAGLPDSITEDVLRQLFEATGGGVAEVSLPRDRATGRPRGFGFVTMSSATDADQARETLHGSFQGGRSISVRPFAADAPKRDPNAGPAGSGPPSGGFRGGRDDADKDRKLYLGNLPYDAAPPEVEAVIAATGAADLQRVILPTDGDGRNRGYGFLQFTTAEAATAALAVLGGAELRGRLLRVLPAQERGERPAGPRDFGPSSSNFGGRDFGGPASDFGGPPRDFNAPPREGAPPAPKREFGPPAPPGGRARRNFDDKKKRSHDDGGAPRGGGGGGGGGGRKGRQGWGSDDDD